MRLRQGRDRDHYGYSEMACSPCPTANATVLRGSFSTLAGEQNVGNVEPVRAGHVKGLCILLIEEVVTMRLLAAVLVCAFAPIAVQAKSVFAHFMVGNTESFKVDDWKREMSLAQAAHIDAFALNMAYDDYVLNNQLPNAFAAAESLGFHVFFSFDYAGNGPWDKDTVKATLKAYTKSSSYFQYNGKPFVSTFEGPENSDDWVDIKSASGCFFIPDWSSLGAKEAVQLGTADGLFSWEAWPHGPADASTYGDASYHQYLNGLPYMAPISPWFYTNMPGYNKNWIWRGDDLWFDRWQQMIMAEYQPDHYIGPLDDRQYVAFGPEFGKSPYNYVENMPHDGWRQFLPFVIDLWKTGTATVGTEGVTAWFRPNPARACSDGGTTGNTATQLLLEYPPAEIAQDKIFYSALLGSDADVTVFVGGRSIPGTWTSKPYANIGMYHGSVDMDGANGNVVVRITRNGNTVMQTSGKGTITAGCANGLTNFNAYVDSGSGAQSSLKTPKPISELVSTAGTGVFAFKELCEFTCKYGYCPQGACTCTNKGEQLKKPDPTGQVGYPLEGTSGSFTGLCNFACNLGYCPPDRCGPTQKPTYEGNVSPFVAPACTSGTGPGNLQGLCQYSCDFGFCPIHVCTCLSTGPLNLPTPKQDPKITKATTTDGTLDYGLCLFACSRGYCPTPCAVDKGLPGGVFTPVEPNTSIGYTLLTVLSDYTLVHMTKDASDEVKSALSQQFCTPSKRAMNKRDASRLNTATSDVAKRDFATDTCVRSTVLKLLRDANVVSILLGLYRGNPIPGTLSRITQLPGFTTDIMDSTFINGLSSASNFLKPAFPSMTTEEILWIYFTLMDTASHYLQNHPGDFTNFAIVREKNLPDQCPNEADTDCASALCDSKDGVFCSAFIGSKCRCSQSKCKVKFDENELKPFCEAPNCQPIDTTTGLCLADGKYNQCPCAGSGTVWKTSNQNMDILAEIWAGPDWESEPDTPEVKPDVLLCYKKGDSTYTAHKDDSSEWKFMEQPVLDKTIDKFCESAGAVDGTGGDSSKTWYDENSGTLNSVNIGFTAKQGGKQTVDDCKKNFKALSANCDWHPTENQYNWKWGGEFTTGLFTYVIQPTGHRLPVRNDPDTDWWRIGGDTHYWNNGKTAKSGEVRLGKDGKAFDMVIMNQCLHHLKLIDWNKGAKQDCAGIVDFSMSARILYNSHDDCFENTWRTIAWKLQYDQVLCGYSNHQAGAAGPGGATCWAGIDFIEGLVAEAAFVLADFRVPGFWSSGERALEVVSDGLFGDEMTAVAPPDFGQDGFAIYGAGCVTRASFEVYRGGWCCEGAMWFVIRPKAPAEGIAPVSSPVILLLYMFPHFSAGVEAERTAFALKRLTPMVIFGHVFASSILRVEFQGTHVAFKAVAGGIHMLTAGRPAVEGPPTNPAFRVPMIKMSNAVPELDVAGRDIVSYPQANYNYPTISTEYTTSSDATVGRFPSDARPSSHTNLSSREIKSESTLRKRTWRSIVLSSYCCDTKEEIEYNHSSSLTIPILYTGRRLAKTKQFIISRCAVKLNDGTVYGDINEQSTHKHVETVCESYKLALVIDMFSSGHTCIQRISAT
ncbi:hypothetical protein OPT61_g4911 [Boeremia exigua]|uniref:Uncharacterized protein n=1 Tax=Boeremia exigua TaxID=749465 RepID=A0ACC2ICD9_9PLEO|nr:hypothetical protein OPT61_g4911 [Boeremia exigua]